MKRRLSDGNSETMCNRQMLTLASLSKYNGLQLALFYNIYYLVDFTNNTLSKQFGAVVSAVERKAGISKLRGFNSLSR